VSLRTWRFKSSLGQFESFVSQGFGAPHIVAPFFLFNAVGPADACIDAN
jgi:hypothetical protein